MFKSVRNNLAKNDIQIGMKTTKWKYIEQFDLKEKARGNIVRSFTGKWDMLQAQPRNFTGITKEHQRHLKLSHSIIEQVMSTGGKVLSYWKDGIVRRCTGTWDMLQAQPRNFTGITKELSH